jgi:hypothetical protein
MMMTMMMMTTAAAAAAAVKHSLTPKFILFAFAVQAYIV